MSRRLFYSLLIILIALLGSKSRLVFADQRAAVGSTPAAAAPVNPKAAEIEALWSAGKKSEAERLLDKWMRDDKKSPWPWVEAAQLQFEQKKFKKSLSYLNTALDKHPQCAAAYYWRGRNFEAQKKPLEAANEYRAALIAQGQYREAQDALDRVQAQLGS